MADFFTDLARHIAAYERGELLDEIERDMTGIEREDDFAANGEAAQFIPSDLVLAAEVPVVRRYGSDDPGRVYIPGCFD